MARRSSIEYERRPRFRDHRSRGSSRARQAAGIQEKQLRDFDDRDSITTARAIRGSAHQTRWSPSAATSSIPICVSPPGREQNYTSADRWSIDRVTKRGSRSARIPRRSGSSCAVRGAALPRGAARGLRSRSQWYARYSAEAAGDRRCAISARPGSMVGHHGRSRVKYPSYLARTRRASRPSARDRVASAADLRTRLR